MQVIGVNPRTPYQNAKELLDAMKAQRRQDFGRDRRRDVGRPQRHGTDRHRSPTSNIDIVTYDGGNPAVVATASGEADVTTQLAVEQADMIRGKRLRPLATS